jgi:glutathione S-transferase
MGSNNLLTLYFAPGSSSMAPHIALNEVGAAFEAIPLSFARNDTRSAAFLAVNPEGKTPALLIDGRLLTEVAGILYYLARAYPAARLMPANDPEAEAHVVSWMSFIASSVHPARRQGLKHAMGVYRLADERLGEGEWAVGDYSIADIHLFRLFWRFASSLNPPPGAFPNLRAHHDRMLARPAVIRTIETEAAIGYELPG